MASLKEILETTREMVSVAISGLTQAENEEERDKARDRLANVLAAFESICYGCEANRIALAVTVAVDPQVGKSVWDRSTRHLERSVGFLSEVIEETEATDASEQG